MNTIGKGVFDKTLLKKKKGITIRLSPLTGVLYIQFHIYSQKGKFVKIIFLQIDS